MTDFDQYIRQLEPDKQEKGRIWQTAIGLQQTDGLKPSSYLIEIAKLNIEGEITFAEAKNRIDNYYKAKVAQQNNSKDDRAKQRSDTVNGGANNEKFGVNGGVNGGVNLLQKQIIDFMLQTPHISVAEIAIQSNKPRRTIENNVKKLKEKGIIVRIGSDKSGQWKINTN